MLRRDKGEDVWRGTGPLLEAPALAGWIRGEGFKPPRDDEGVGVRDAGVALSSDGDAESSPTGAPLDDAPVTFVDAALPFRGLAEMPAPLASGGRYVGDSARTAIAMGLVEPARSRRMRLAGFLPARAGAEGICSATSMIGVKVIVGLMHVLIGEAGIGDLGRSDEGWKW